MKKNTLIMIVSALVIAGIFQTNAAAQEKVALYRYIAPKSENDVYAASASLRDSLKKKGYQEIGVVGYVYLTEQPGTTALYHYFTPDGNKGFKNFYTSNLQEVLVKEKENWQSAKTGAIAFVPKSSGDGVKSVYRFLNTDSDIYAFSKTEIDGFTQQGKKNAGFAFFIYSASQKPVVNAPDAQIGEIIKATDDSITFMARSIGGDIGANEMAVAVMAYKPDGSLAWQRGIKMPNALPNGKKVETTIKINKEGGDQMSLAGLKFKLKLDGYDQLKEPLENNNESKLTDGPPLKIITGKIDTPIIILPMPVGAVDLTARKALYFTGTEKQSVSTKFTYAAPDKPLTLNKSQAISCNTGGCYFNLGFFVQRPQGDGELTTSAMFRGTTIGVFSKTVKFAAGQRSQDLIETIELKFGENKIKVVIDPDQKIAETDENNNSFEVTMIVVN